MLILTQVREEEMLKNNIYELTRSKLDKNYAQRILDSEDIDIILGKTKLTGKLRNIEITFI